MSEPLSNLPSEDDLKKLPLRAIVAYAARCARRVQPLYQSVNEKHVTAVDNAITIAEQFVAADARVAAAAAADARVAAAAAADARVAAAAAADAAFARADAAEAVREAMVIDYQYLLSRTKGRHGKFPSLGEPIDVKSLGPLWPNGKPEGWPDDANEALLKQIEQSQPKPLISVCFDDSGFTAEEVETVLAYISEVYQEEGGIGLKPVKGNTLTPVEEEEFV